MKSSLIVYGRAVDKKCRFASIHFSLEYKCKKLKMVSIGNPKEYNVDTRAYVVLYNDWHIQHGAYA